jgi:hypothetical protein
MRSSGIFLVGEYSAVVPTADPTKFNMNIMSASQHHQFRPPLDD